MKKRWFVVILTIGLLLSVLPLSALALSPDPTITDSDGTIIGWEDLSTVSDFLDDSQEQKLAVADAQSGTAAVSGLSETGSGKSLADADNDEAADGLSAVNSPPPYTLSLDKEQGDEEQGDEEQGDEEQGDEEPEDATPADGTGSTKAKDVCKIGDTPYTSLQSAINAAGENDQIDLLADIELDTGLEFHSKKNLTISGGGTRTLTLEQYGMYAEYSEITFKDLTLTIHADQHTYEHSAGNTANLITHSSTLHLSHVEFSLTPDKNLGSGIFLEDDSDLYFENNTYAEISGFAAEEASGIYAEKYSKDGHGIWVTSSSLNVTDCGWNGMTIDPINLTLKDAGVYLTRNGTSGKGGLGCYGVGKIGGTLTMENSTLTTTGNSGNYKGYGIYVGVLDMDAASTLYATDNQGSGVGIGNSRCGESHIYGQIYCSGNGTSGISGGGGFNVHAQHDDRTYEGNVILEPGAYLYACNNKGLAGVLNNWILKIENGATVIADNNDQIGFMNALDACTTIESGANVSANYNLHGLYNAAGYGNLAWQKGFFLIESGAQVTVNNNKQFGIYNCGDSNTPTNDHFTIQGDADVSADGNGCYGIYNDGGIFTVENGANVSVCNNGSAGNFFSAGIFNTCSGTFTVESNVDLQVEYNQNSGIVNNENATLKLLSGRVRYNTTSTWYGGGLRNYSTATLSNDVQLYNNHAVIGGDDIENGTTATITFGPTGRGWELDGEPDCYDFIDGWYDDYEATRWNAHEENEADLHMDLVAPVTLHTGPLSLKAAHGALGSLTVRKETIGELLPSDYDTAFTFELTLDDDTITTINDQWCGVPFQNGKASFTLKSGESITLSNLPAGVGYTLAEQSKGGWRLARVDGDAEGVVPQRTTAAITFINEKLPSTGSLVISKEILGDLIAEDADTEFNFVLTLADTSITTADAKEYGVVFEDGKAAFTLKGGESITIANLPAGMSYTLAEQSKGGWRLAWVDGDAEGVVPLRTTAAITFVNEKLSSTGSLVISKEILGDLTAEDADTGFYFMLTLDDGSITTADAKEYGVVFENGWATFTLKGGESITITNLPTGVGYTLIETRQKGWTLQSVSGETTGVIPQNDTAEITFVNQKDDSFVPVDPVDPAAPVTPEVPETPAQDEAPALSPTPEAPAKAVASASPLPQTPEAPAKAVASASTLPQTGTTDWLAVVLLLSGFGLLGCGWFFDRKQRAAKH